MRADGRTSVWLKRMVVSCGMVAFTAVGLTALDKHDERTCRQNPALVALSRYDPLQAGMWQRGPDPPILINPPSLSSPPPDYQPLSVPEICDGFLPW